MEEPASNPALVKNLMQSFGNIFYSHISDSTQERIFKDGLIEELRILVEKLNHEYQDVNFYLKFQIGVTNGYLGEESQYFVRGFDKDIADDSLLWHEELKEPENIDKMYNEDISEIGIKLSYVWSRTCNIGHQHRTTRFYYYSMPKITELLNFHLQQNDLKEFVKRYVPNFFY